MIASLIAIGVSFAAAGAPKSAQPAAPAACTPENVSKWSHELIDYLKRPASAKTKALVELLCSSAPEGTAPCPINVNEERVADFAAAAQKTPEVIPVIACAAPSAEAAEAQELNDLQSRLLDKYKGAFFEHWLQVPKKFHESSQKLADFVSLAPDAPDDYKRKIALYKIRIPILEHAPASLKTELASSIDDMKEEVKNAGTDGGGAVAKSGAKAASSDSDEGIIFKTSDFRSQIADKLTRFTAFDAKRATTLANEILLNEGLNYKAYLKSESKTWNLCSASTNVEGACQSSTVGFENGRDSCGRFGIFAVIFQAGQTWVLMSGSSSYRINMPDLLEPLAVKLEKNGNARTWNIPEGFIPEFLGEDLHSLYLVTSLKTDAGKKLGDLHLLVRDNGRSQFVELPTTGLIKLTGAQSQTIKTPDGTTATIELPKRCR